MLAQKPFKGSYCDNIEKWGVGAINVDGCRVSGEVTTFPKVRNDAVTDCEQYGKYNGQTRVEGAHPLGCFPANVVLAHGPFCTEESCMDGCPVKVLDEQSGGGSKVFAKFFYEEADFVPFFYCPKPSKRERDAGLEDLPPVSAAEITGRKPGSPGLVMEGGKANPYAGITGTFRRNYHPTVKPLKLVRYLQRLVTPPGGITASPFLGSGTDVVAAILEGFNFWGMEIAEEYWPIIEARVAWAREQVKKEASRTAVQQARLSL